MLKQIRPTSERKSCWVLPETSAWVCVRTVLLWEAVEALCAALSVTNGGQTTSATSELSIQNMEWLEILVLNM